MYHYRRVRSIEELLEYSSSMKNVTLDELRNKFRYVHRFLELLVFISSVTRDQVGINKVSLDFHMGSERDQKSIRTTFKEQSRKLLEWVALGSKWRQNKEVKLTRATDVITSTVRKQSIRSKVADISVEILATAYQFNAQIVFFALWTAL